MKINLVIPFAILLFILPQCNWAQFISITGYINDVESGKALEDVSVFEANSGIGTISNQNGFYKLILEKGSIRLNISENGFQSFSKKMDLKADTIIVVKLQPKMNGKSKHKKFAELHANIKSNKKSHSLKWFKQH